MKFGHFRPEIAAECFEIVVGAGPAGLALAMRLVERGRIVAVLEAGDEIAVADFPGLSTYEMAGAEGTHGKAVDTVRQGLGGTSSVWGARCSMPDPYEFMHRPHVGHSDTYIPFAEFMRFKDLACKFFGFAPDTFDTISSSQDSQPVSSNHRIRVCRVPDIAKYHRTRIEEEQRLKVFLNTRVLRLEYDSADEKVARVRIESRGAITEIAPTRVILACGGIQNARLLLGIQRDNPTFLNGENGPLGRYYMGHLSGAIARIRLSNPASALPFLFSRMPDGSHECRAMTLSSAKKMQHGLLDSHFGMSNFPLADSQHKNGTLSLIHLLMVLRYRSGGYMQKVWSAYTPTKHDLEVQPLRHLKNVFRNLPQSLAGCFPVAMWLLERRSMPGFQLQNPRGIYTLGYHAEHAPDPESRVTLSGKVDAHGVPLPKVDLRFSDDNVESILTSYKILADWITETGLGSLDWYSETEAESRERIRARASDGYHQIGLTRISSSPMHGVVDENLTVWRCKNLHVVGCSTLPVSGKSNPTFPAVVLAIRLADWIAGKDYAANGQRLGRSANIVSRFSPSEINFTSDPG